MYCADDIDATVDADCRALECRMRTFAPDPEDDATSMDSWHFSNSLLFKCYSCAREHDVALRAVRHASIFAMPCAMCAMPLHEAPPTEPHVGPRWQRNTSHRHPRGRTCLRCMRRRAPQWSVTLRAVCRDWRRLPTDSVLYIVIYNLGMRTLYKVPWKGGLDRIALFGRFRVSSRPL